MKIRFWGTRGSVPSAGPSTTRYGGNTSCIEVRLDDGTLIILDAGTGIRALGEAHGCQDATLLLTHYHWDHIQGLPFFGPAYCPESRISVIGPEFNGQGPGELLEQQMQTPFFPVPPVQLRGLTSFATTPHEPFTIGGATVWAGQVCHPGTTLGYRLQEGNATLAYVSDNEMDLAGADVLAGMVELVRGADVLIHDCQYSEQEYDDRRGWGHSTPRQAVALATAAGVRRLVLFHHDPSHTDEQVEALAAEAERLGSQEIIIAHEGELLSVGESGPRLLPRHPRQETRLTRRSTA